MSELLQQVLERGQALQTIKNWNGPVAHFQVGSLYFKLHYSMYCAILGPYFVVALTTQLIHVTMAVSVMFLCILPVFSNFPQLIQLAINFFYYGYHKDRYWIFKLNGSHNRKIISVVEIASPVKLTGIRGFYRYPSSPCKFQYLKNLE